MWKQKDVRNVLEKMDAFFEERLEGYDEHMLTEIEGAKAFYPFTAAQLPIKTDASVLDLGCGTGLELQWYFTRNPSAKITGVDMTQAMLNKLKEKFSDKKLTLICGSYFDVPFSQEPYDAAVSVESLHHFTQAQKIPLYRKVYAALKRDGCFILTDYFACSSEEEDYYFQELQRLKCENGITENAFYHYDTPLTVEHEKDALLIAGFKKVTVLQSWHATYCLRAEK